jgi:hypothetical protein
MSQGGDEGTPNNRANINLSQFIDVSRDFETVAINLKKQKGGGGIGGE